MSDPKGSEAERVARDLVDNACFGSNYATVATALKQDIAAALRSFAAARVAEAVERCAKVAERYYGGPAHTYASENSELYRAQDKACKDIAAAIRTPASSKDGE